MTDPRNITMAAMVDILIGLGKVTRGMATLAMKAVEADKPKAVEIEVKAEDAPEVKE